MYEVSENNLRRWMEKAAWIWWVSQSFSTSWYFQVLQEKWKNYSEAVKPQATVQYLNLVTARFKCYFFWSTNCTVLQDINVTVDKEINVVIWKICVCCAQLLSRVPLFVTPWMVAHQAPLSTEFSRQEYWSGLPFPTPRDFFHPGIKTASLVSPALTGGFLTTSTTWECM